MAILSIALLALVIQLGFKTVEGAQCETYSGSFCQGIVNYPVYVTPERGQAITEVLLVSITQAILDPAKRIDPECATAVLEYSCGGAYPRCYEVKDSNNTVIGVDRQRVCKESCLRFNDKCGDIINKIDPSLLPDCDGLITGDTVPFPTTDCVAFNLAYSVPKDFTCPDPFIVNPYNHTSDFCFGECCLPCPQGDYFYKKSQQGIYDPVIIPFSLVSLVLSTFIMITYILMPDKRRYPSNIILFISISVFLFYITQLFNAGAAKQMRCHDEITLALPGTDGIHGLCYVESALVTYGLLTGVMWYFLLVLNVFMNVVFLTKRMKDYRHYYSAFIWFVPLIAVIYNSAAKRVGYMFGVWCLLDPQSLKASLMYPIACFIFPSVALNFATLIKIAMVAKSRNATIQNILKLQIRSFFFVTTILFIFLFYWLHYETKLSKVDVDVNAQWVKDWGVCIITGGTQDSCAEQVKDYVPNLPLFLISEILLASVGIVIFVFFGLKIEVYTFYKQLFTGHVSKIFETADSSYDNSNNNTTKMEKKQTGITVSAKEEDM